MSYQEQQDAIKSKVTGVVNDISDRASDVADRAGRQADGARKDLSRTASDLTSRAKDALDSAGVDTDSLSKAFGSSFDMIAKSVRSNVRDRPLGALAVTAAIALLIGAMSSR
jgi:ElaB/YqjD/DUF883 family membrane-anchored ribosome-binding protein